MFGLITNRNLYDEIQKIRKEMRQSKRLLLTVSSDLEKLSREVREEMVHVQEKIDALKAEIEPLASAVDGLVTLIDGIVQDIEDAKDDPAELQEVLDGIRSQKDKLVAATLKHTPAEPPVEPQP